jgi:Putative adhesin
MSLKIRLTPARRVILAVGVPLVLALIGFAAIGWSHVAIIQLANGEPVGYARSFSAPASGGQSRLTINNADVGLRPGPGSRILVRTHLFGSIAKPRFDHHYTSRGLVLNPYCAVPIGGCSLSLAVSVPGGLPVTATDNFGSMTATDLHGRVTLTDNSGNLTATALAGTIRLDNPFGDLNASRLSGTTELSSNSGDINVTGITGGTRLTDNFANITVHGLAASDVKVTDTNGDVFLVFSKVPRTVNVTDTFGNVTLMLPPGPATYQVHAPRPLFGIRSIKLPESATSSNVITVHNSNGDIIIRNG